MSDRDKSPRTPSLVELMKLAGDFVQRKRAYLGAGRMPDGRLVVVAAAARAISIPNGIAVSVGPSPETAREVARILNEYADAIEARSKPS